MNKINKWNIIDIRKSVDWKIGIWLLAWIVSVPGTAYTVAVTVAGGTA